MSERRDQLKLELGPPIRLEELIPKTQNPFREVLKPETLVYSGSYYTGRKHPVQRFAAFDQILTQKEIIKLLALRTNTDEAKISPYDLQASWHEMDQLPERIVKNQTADYESFRSFGRNFRAVTGFDKEVLARQAAARLIPYDKAIEKAGDIWEGSVYRELIYRPNGWAKDPGVLPTPLTYEFLKFALDENADLEYRKANSYERKRGKTLIQLRKDQILSKINRLPHPELFQLVSNFWESINLDRKDQIFDHFVRQRRYAGKDTILLESGEIIKDDYPKNGEFKFSPDRHGEDKVYVERRREFVTDVVFSNCLKTKRTENTHSSVFLLPVLRWSEDINGNKWFDFNPLSAKIEKSLQPLVPQMPDKRLQFNPKFMDPYTGYFIASLFSDLFSDEAKINPDAYPVRILKPEMRRKVMNDALRVNLANVIVAELV